MKRFIYFLTALIILLPSTELRNNSDFQVFRDLAAASEQEGRYGDALNIYQQGIELAARLNNKTAEGYLLNDKGVVYLDRLKDRDNARNCFESAAAIGEQLGHHKISAYSSLNFGIFAKQISDYNKAMSSLTEAARLMEADFDTSGQASALNTIGNLQRQRELYPSALQYHMEALDLRRRIVAGDDMHLAEIRTDIASSLNNIGEVYKDMHQYDSARHYLYQSLLLKQTLGDEGLMASTQNVLADIYFEQGDTIRARNIYYRTYRLRKTHRDRIGLVNSANKVAKVLLCQGAFKQAGPFIVESIGIAETDSLKRELLTAYELARKLYRLTGRQQLALEYDDRYILLSRELNNADKLRILEDTEAKYQNDKKEQELEEERQESDRIRQQLLLAGTTTLLLLIIAGITVAANYRIRKLNRLEEQARQEAERAREQIEALWTELNHRVKNNLQILSSMMSLQVSQQTDERIKQVFLDMQNRVSAMAVMHRKLYMNHDLTLIGVHVLITDLVEDLKTTFGMPGLELSASLEETTMVADKAITFGLIANEILTNAFKYGLAGAQHPRLSILLSTRDHKTALTISDNGPGIPDEKGSARSFGFRLIRIFCQQLKAQLEIRNSEGAQITVILDNAHA